MMSEDERSELKDKVEEFFKAGDKGDFDGATDAFEDMWSLVDDDSEEEPAGEGKGEEKDTGKGKPLAALILSSKK